MSRRNDAPGLQISLTAHEALVLFEFLSRFEAFDELTIANQTEQRARANLLCLLQKQLVPPFQRKYLELLNQARNRLRDDLA